MTQRLLNEFQFMLFIKLLHSAQFAILHKLDTVPFVRDEQHLLQSNCVGRVLMHKHWHTEHENAHQLRYIVNVSAQNLDEILDIGHDNIATLKHIILVLRTHHHHRLLIIIILFTPFLIIHIRHLHLLTIVVISATLLFFLFLFFAFFTFRTVPRTLSRRSCFLIPRRFAMRLSMSRRRRSWRCGQMLQQKIIRRFFNRWRNNFLWKWTRRRR
mmetsp:Transcript_23701/g.37986  ORF Transcript_23701/g.37986 Transcript_23701/m.37986 type:complete len:213 (+) Transcript_23701:643-1281(+)